MTISKTSAWINLKMRIGQAALEKVVQRMRDSVPLSPSFEDSPQTTLALHVEYKDSIETAHNSQPMRPFVKEEIERAVDYSTT